MKFGIGNQGQTHIYGLRNDMVLPRPCWMHESSLQGQHPIPRWSSFPKLRILAPATRQRSDLSCFEGQTPMLAWLNGPYTPEDEFWISPNHRGFIFAPKYKGTDVFLKDPERHGFAMTSPGLEAPALN